MPPRSISVPPGTFASHAKHLRAQRRSASTAASNLPTAAALPEMAPVWRSRTEPLTRLGHSITGAMEWQTSTYSFNKQAVKPIPVVSTNVEKLIYNYVTMKRVNNEGKDVRAIRTALALRRKSAEKVYVSKPKIKDYGDRVEVKCFVWDGREALKEEFDKMKRGSSSDSGGGGDKQRKNDSDLILDPKHQVGLQSLIAKMYGKQVNLQMIKIKRPHLDADILAAYVAQRLRDRRFTPRRVIRDATWKAPLPSAQAVANITNAKLRATPQKFSWQDFTLGNVSRTSATGIVESLALSQVSSIQIEAAGRLTKRLTANRSAKKMTRRGTTSKGPAHMLRGFRKAHTQFAFAGGKRRVGQFGIKVHVGHT